MTEEQQRQKINKNRNQQLNMAKSKPRVIKNYEKLDEKLREAIAARFPNGYSSEIRTFDIGGGRFMSALPFETEDFFYMIKFPVTEEQDEEQDELGGNDDLDLEGGEDVEEEEEEDEVEKPLDGLEDIADDAELDK